MENGYVSAEAFLPGDFLDEELDARGWTRSDLADIVERPNSFVSDLVSGRRRITAEIAMLLGEAFGTSPNYWLDLEAAYRLAQAKRPKDIVGRRALLYAKAPVRQMQQRGWLTSSSAIDGLEAEACAFFGLRTIDDPIVFGRAAARKSTSYQGWTKEQTAWLFRARQLAASISPATFTAKRFDQAVAEMREVSSDIDRIERVPEILSQAGIRLVIVDHLRRTKIDGACFWLGTREPVVALSLRFDRVDHFWYTLFHELGHVKAGDGKSDAKLDDETLHEGEKPREERQADEFARSELIDPEALRRFVRTSGGRYSRAAIVAFAAEQRLHPGIVVGRLHHDRRVPFSHHRRFVDQKVRAILARTAVVDGGSRRYPSFL